MTATALRDEAAARIAKAERSYQECDTDGALSQIAHGLLAQELTLAAEIEANGGRYKFPALFDLDGNLVPAKLVQTRYGMAWGLLKDDNPRGRFIGWFNPSNAKKAETRRRNDERKGYRIGYVMAPARAELRGGNIACLMAKAVRTDGGFSRDVEIIDDGTQGTYYAYVCR